MKGAIHASATGLDRTPALDRIGDYPAYFARHTPHADAVVTPSDVLSYEAFDGEINELARAMLAQGVRRGDRVAILAPPSPVHLAHFMAAARIGAAWVGLNPRHTSDELEVVLRDAAPRLVVVTPEYDGRDYRETFGAFAEGCLADAVVVSLGGAARGLTGWRDVLATGQSVTDDALAAAVAEVTADDTVAIVYTSGTTGTPKGAMLSHRSVVTTARIQCAHWWAQPLRILNNLPINHIGGAVQIACHALVAGGANVLMERFDPVALPTVVRDRGVTVIHQVPTMYQLLLDRGAPTDEDFASVQVLIWSGAAASRPLVERLRRFCDRLYTSYGQTETGGEVLYSPEGAGDEELVDWVGLPDPRIEVRVAPQAEDDPPSAGELQVRGPTVMTGYWGRPEDTAATVTDDGWLRTGDLAEVGPDGRLRIVGRLRDMFKSGGYNVYPREVEQVLELHPGVSTAAVLGVPDPMFGEVGEAWVLTISDAISPRDLDAHCRAHLANYKVPKTFHLRRDLPLLPVGKIDKVALRALSRPEGRVGQDA
ncbi:class I adenylate-forming enzyme family protein [Intrasporangium sp.]|uniref:class I adenylate-forming enzyme family protein n=1 Tax=Intrasporangium sp. TaxID=1925024 RepID=UPI002939674D|nr:class I adenylate-forming enzyme family protein [Intrasporangium sp.]MDV3219881.1 acyl--CoA ligase [Intrasporangium sp.]